MTLLKNFLSKRLSKEEIEETTVTVDSGAEPDAVTVTTTSETTVDPTAAAPADADTQVVTAEPDTATAAEPDVDAELDAVRAEVETAQSEQSDVAEAKDVSERLDETVASMEALLDRGFASTAEVKLAVRRGHALLERLEVPFTQFSTESCNSEEGRLETLSLSAESFKEQAGKVAGAITAAAKRIKDRIVKSLHALVSVDERYNQLGKQLIAAAAKRKGAVPSGTTVKLSSKAAGYLVDGQGQPLDPSAVASAILEFTKYLTGEYSKQLAEVKVGDVIQPPKVSEGLPRAPVSEVHTDKHSTVITFKLSSKGASSSEFKALNADEIEAVGKVLVEATDLLRSDWILYLVEDESGPDFDLREQLASSLIDAAIYVRFVLSSLYSVADQSLKSLEDAE